MSDTQQAATIPLAPELTARVRVVAERQGLAPEEALSRLLERALADEERDFQETVAALRVSLTDGEVGALPLDEWRAQSLAWAAVHRAQEAA